MRLSRRALLVLVIGSAACGGGKSISQHDASGLGGTGGPSGFGKTYEQDVSRSVDILFLIDDSSEMVRAQQELLRDFPTFVTTLQSLPGGMPDVHIGVISSDMGAGDGSIPGCNTSGGKNGILQSAPHDSAVGMPCAATLQAGAKYLSNSGGVPNHTGNLADAFNCIAALGEQGCRFEHQFAAILRALGADNRTPPPENQGFLRPYAHLVIVLLTNEDDCSASPGVPLFDTAQNKTLGSQLGPPTNFRCNEFGHLCDGAHPTRAAPSNDVAAMLVYAACTSNDSEGYLLSVVDTANRIKALKTDPSKILVASIQGLATPYAVRWRAPLTADTSCGSASCPWPEIAHACTASDATFADPGVRTGEFVSQFGASGLTLPICSDSFGPSLQRVAESIGGMLEPFCITGQLKDDPSKPGLQPDCAVTAHARQANGTVVDTPVASCADSLPPCWTVTRDRPSCGGDAAVLFSPGAGSPAASSLKVTCALCVPGESAPSSCL